MKVGDRKDGLNPALEGIGGSADPARANGPLIGPGPSQDEVRVSQVARALARLIAGIDGEALAAVRAERVEPLRAAVARGEYRVDLQATARSFLREVLGDLAR